ncbi:S1 family peptidase [Vibrio ziniensis]|uniref:Serine protease n=1 Tax=Vibrio ziniensis TaxID=2711221 RepID=A0A6G7CQ04_9VIBR|nr:serine protease [Vibrio ziniensis]QIH44126.1 serine protease [Vibrio ziniensis]
MKRRFASLLAIIAASYQVSAAEDYQSYIVNGSYANITTFSSYAALFIDLIDYNGTYYEGSYCGGTILDSTHILTAAHCVYTSDPDNSLYSLFTTVVPNLQYESYFPYNIPEKTRVAKIYYRDDYDSSSLNNDLAILELESELLTISESNYSIRPSTGSDYRDVSESFVAVGHGNTETGVDQVDYLQRATLSYVPNSSCEYGNITDTKLCMEGAVSLSNGLETSTCQGDSGGPLYWYSGGEYIQVGLTSYGPGTFCGDSRYSATSVFTEIYNYADWIDSVLAGDETAKYVVTEATRLAYVGISDSSSSTSDNGGSLGSWFLVFMSLFVAIRRNYNA